VHFVSLKNKTQPRLNHLNNFELLFHCKGCYCLHSICFCRRITLLVFVIVFSVVVKLKYMRRKYFQRLGKLAFAWVTVSSKRLVCRNFSVWYSRRSVVCDRSYTENVLEKTIEEASAKLTDLCFLSRKDRKYFLNCKLHLPPFRLSQR